VHVISIKRLQDFWEAPGNPDAERALRWWYQQVRQALWETPAGARATFNTTDQFGRKTVFDVGGNKYRVIAVIDYERHKVFIRFVLDHKAYDERRWKKDAFGEDWKKREVRPPVPGSRGRRKGRTRGRRRGRGRR
jgi:mRNA interferase HigB